MSVYPYHGQLFLFDESFHDVSAGSREVLPDAIGRHARQGFNLVGLHAVDMLHAENGLLPVRQRVDELQQPSFRLPAYELLLRRPAVGCFL